MLNKYKNGEELFISFQVNKNGFFSDFIVAKILYQDKDGALVEKVTHRNGEDKFYFLWDELKIKWKVNIDD